MRIDNISTTNFDGKIKYLRGIKPREKQFAEQILDYEVNGISNKAFLSTKNFNIGFYDSKKNASDKMLYLSIPIRYLKKSGDKIRSFEDIQVHEISTSDVEKGAIALRGIMEKVNEDIMKRYPMHYNNWLQKIVYTRLYDVLTGMNVGS